jgi:RNA polymerase sigma factor (TIGR02999 family)
MRRVLVDHARKKRSTKRGKGFDVPPLDVGEVAAPYDPDLVALDEALNALASLDPRQAKVVEFRYFAGLSIDETAEAMSISAATVERDWSTARIWLRRQLVKGARE